MENTSSTSEFGRDEKSNCEDLLVQRIEKQSGIVGEFQAELFHRRFRSVEADIGCGGVEPLRVSKAGARPHNISHFVPCSFSQI